MSFGSRPDLDNIDAILFQASHERISSLYSILKNIADQISNIYIYIYLQLELYAAKIAFRNIRPFNSSNYNVYQSTSNIQHADVYKYTAPL